MGGVQSYMEYSSALSEADKIMAAMSANSTTRTFDAGTYSESSKKHADTVVNILFSRGYVCSWYVEPTNDPFYRDIVIKCK